jgi:hypothetical protein
MIPDLIEISPHTPWCMLPAGIHAATLNEVDTNFAYTPHRKSLFDGFCKAVSILRYAGCCKIYLDGSFVTAKIHPDDFDAAWDINGVDPTKLDPILLRYENKRLAQKSKYGGEFFIATSQATHGINYLNYFQNDKYSGQTKGILSIQFGGNV